MLIVTGTCPPTASKGCGSACTYCAESGLSFPEQEASAIIKMAAIARNGRKFFLFIEYVWLFNNVYLFPLELPP